MCPRTSIQFEEIRKNRKKQIMFAAVECFASSGYHSVSISDLARHAGISKGLLYNYFSSKEELLKTIFHVVYAEMLDIFNPEHVKEFDRDTLLKYLDNLFRHLQSNLITWKLYIAIFSQPAVIQILEKELQKASRRPLKMVERYFRKQGSKNPAVDVAFLSVLTSGVAMEYISDPGNFPLEQIKKRILSLY